MNRIKIFLAATLSIFVISSQAQVSKTAEEVNPLATGAGIPEGSLVDMDGNTISLKDAVGGKAVLVFYRGGWCPYCNVHLAELQEILGAVDEAGYRLLAISPDSPEYLSETSGKNDLSYTLYSDPGLAVAKSFGLVFEAPDKYGKMLADHSGGTNPGILPIPALYVVDDSGIISYVYTNPDYKTRLSGEEVLAALD